MPYGVEAQGPSCKTILTIGAKEGYDNGKVYRREELTDLLKSAHTAVQKQHKFLVPCKVSSSTLVGRASDPTYEEELYTLEFSYSPRSSRISVEQFNDAIQSYVTILGESMRQTRVYCEAVESQTIVYKREDST